MRELTGKSRNGGPDKRGSNRNRKARKLRMLADARFGGTGRSVPCVHCGKRLTFGTVEADRKIPGGSYAYSNVQPSCGPCNKQRGDESAG
jgi:hypothetical protein